MLASFPGALMPLLRCATCFFVLLLAQQPHIRAEESVYKIGAILPLTGVAAPFGVNAKCGLEMAMDELSEADRRRIQVFIEDDGLDATRSVSAARRLLDVQKVDALIAWSSSTGMSIVNITEQKGIPLIAVASDPQIARNRQFAFTYWALPEDEVSALYEVLVRHGVAR